MIIILFNTINYEEELSKYVDFYGINSRDNFIEIMKQFN